VLISLATCQRRSAKTRKNGQFEVLGIEGNTYPSSRAGFVEFLERLPAISFVPIGGQKDDVGHNPVCVALE
jgi:hypothetical protein